MLWGCDFPLQCSFIMDISIEKFVGVSHKFIFRYRSKIEQQLRLKLLRNGLICDEVKEHRIPKNRERRKGRGGEKQLKYRSLFSKT